MADRTKEEGMETDIYEGRLFGIFKGYRNYDTIFKFQGGSSWRQDEYLYRSHYLDSPNAKVVKVLTKKDRKEIFYIEVEGTETPVKVKPSYG